MKSGEKIKEVNIVILDSVLVPIQKVAKASKENVTALRKELHLSQKKFDLRSTFRTEY